MMTANDHAQVMKPRRFTKEMTSALAFRQIAESALNPPPIHRVIRLQGGSVISGEFFPLVHYMAYRIGKLDHGANERYKEGGFVAVYTMHHENWGVRPNDMSTWLFHYSEDGYKMYRRCAWLNVWCGHVELPILKGLATDVSEQFRMATRLRVRTPQAIERYEAELSCICAIEQHIAVRSDLLAEAFGKLQRQRRVNTAHLTADYPVMWCVENRVREVAWLVAASQSAYLRIGDVMKTHNALVVQVCRGLYDDLLQMVTSEGNFATEHRHERLREYIDVAASVKARPWRRVMAYGVNELEQAAKACEEGSGDLARALVSRFAQALKTLLLRDEVQDVIARLSIVDKMKVELTKAEIEALVNRLQTLAGQLSSSHDKMLLRPVRERLIVSIAQARLLIMAGQRYDIALKNLNDGVDAV